MVNHLFVSALHHPGKPTSKRTNVSVSGHHGTGIDRYYSTMDLIPHDHGFKYPGRL